MRMRVGPGKVTRVTSKWKSCKTILVALLLARLQEGGTPVIHVWNVLAGREVGELAAREGGVVSLLFTPDGKHLISGATDTTALTWDLTRETKSAVQRLDKRAVTP
jgi:hypothetical protein